MNDVPRDELLSALIDGELSDSERSQAEQLLADDPSSRQLYEDLRLVRATVAGLPRVKLGGDISARIIRRAERRMLLEGVPPRGQVEAVDLAADEDPVPAEAIWKRGWRVVLWPALAVAAALLLMVFNPAGSPPPDEADVAQHPSLADRLTQLNQGGKQSQSKLVSGNSVAADAPPTDAVNNGPQSSSSVASTSSMPGGSATSETGLSETPAQRANNSREVSYIVAEVVPEVLDQSGFHEVLGAEGISLIEEAATPRIPLRIGGPLASERTSGETQREAAYVVTAKPEQIQKLVAALEAQHTSYTIVERKGLPTPKSDDTTDGQGAADAPEVQSAIAARKFASLVEAEEAAKKVSADSASAVIAANLVTAVFVLRKASAQPEAVNSAPVDKPRLPRRER